MRGIDVPGLDKDHVAVATMFDRVAPRYDVLNTLMTGGAVHRWRRAVDRAVAPLPGEQILDVAAGTGASSIHLALTGAEVVACDVSRGMLAEGRRRHPDLALVEGSALDLPFPDHRFDAVTITFGLRNVADPDAALREMLRVCRPGGRLVVCEVSTPRSAAIRTVRSRLLPGVLSLLGRLASSHPAAYGYLADSTLAWPDQEALARQVSTAGWERVEFRDLSGGVVAIHRARSPQS